MTTKTVKVLFFAILIAAIAIPVSGMDFVSGQEQVTKQKLRIDEPQDSAAKIAVHERAMALFAEKQSLYDEGASFKAKYEAEGPGGLTSEDRDSLDRITSELIGVDLRIDQMNADARALITLTQPERESLEKSLVIIRESTIPFTGVWTDENGKAVGVSFENQELADKYAPVIETMIDVPFYTEIRGTVIVDTCTSLTADCDPLLGGVKITSEFSSGTGANCSYSTAVDRNVWWWVDYGFLTAAHCFQNNANGNDVWQPLSTSSKIGDLNMWKWDTTNAKMDAAFVLKSGTETHAAAAYNGAPAIYFGGFANPAVNDYVTIVGQNGIHTGLQVDSLTWSGNVNSLDPTPITHAMTNMIDMDNWGTSSGDSGGVVHASGSNPNYHGVIHGHIISLGSGSNGHTIASAWSNIDAHFGFNQ